MKRTRSWPLLALGLLALGLAVVAIRAVRPTGPHPVTIAADSHVTTRARIAGTVAEAVHGRYVEVLNIAEAVEEVAAVERRATDLELGAQLELEPLLELRRELATLKSEALDRFSNGELEGHELVSGSMTVVNAVRDLLGRLILHVRQNVEEIAEAEGRSAEAVWNEAIESSGAAEAPSAGEPPAAGGATPPRSG